MKQPKWSGPQRVPILLDLLRRSIPLGLKDKYPKLVVCWLVGVATMALPSLPLCWQTSWVCLGTRDMGLRLDPFPIAV